MSQDGFLSTDEINKNTELFLSAAKTVRDGKEQAESKPQDGRCPFSHRPGKKAKEAKKAKDNKEGNEEARETKEANEEAKETKEANEEAKETKEAKEPEDEKKSEDKDVKDEL